MDKTGAPCEACGGLLPLKPIQRRSKQRQSPSLQPKQSLQHIDSQTEPGSATTSHNEILGDLETNSLPSLSTNFDVEEPSGNKKRSYDSVLEEIQAIFAGQKVKRVTIASYIDLYQRQRDRKAKQHERSQQATVSKPHSPTTHCSPSSPPQRREPVCKRVVRQLPPNCSFDPLRISPSPSHHLGEHSKGEPQATRCSSPPCSPSRQDHGAVDNHQQQACRPNRVDHYHDVLRLYEECDIHEIDERINTATLSTSTRKHRYEERGFQTHEPQQILYQHVCQQTVVRLHEGCHLHQRATMSLRPPCQRCGCSQQEGSAEDKCNTEHHQRNIRRSSEQEVRDAISPVLRQKEKASEDLQGPIPKDHKRAGTILGCHLHCQESTDPLEWTPRRVWKAKKPCSLHWLDRVTASQHIPSHIVHQYLQGKRRCPLRWRKQKCDACAAAGKVDPCAKPAAWCLSSGSDISSPVVECKKWTRRREKLPRLALSRVLIVKPVPKVSTSQGLWTRKEFEECSECRDLKMFRSVGIKSGRWSSILKTISSSSSSSSLCATDRQQHEEMTNNCSTKYSSHTVHGLSVPAGGTVDLRGPEVNSASRLHRKLHMLQSEIFDRRAAMQVAQTEGIELDKEVFNLLPDAAKTLSQGGSSRRAYTVRRRKRWEVYRGLSKIVELSRPPCQQCTLREVGVQVYNRNSPPVGNIWNPSDFCPEVQSALQPSTPNPTTHCFNWPGKEHAQNCQAPDPSSDEQHWEYVVEACRQTRFEQGDCGSCHA